MIFLVTPINSVLQSIGISFTGSIILLSLLILIFFGLLMFISNIPSQFILVVFSILIIGMNAIWGGSVLRILSIITAIIFGTVIGLFIIKFFSNYGA